MLLLRLMPLLTPLFFYAFTISSPRYCRCRYAHLRFRRRLRCFYFERRHARHMLYAADVDT